MVCELTNIFFKLLFIFSKLPVTSQSFVRDLCVHNSDKLENHNVFYKLKPPNTLNGIIISNTKKSIRRNEKVTEKPYNILEWKELRCYEQ